jgi:hypothetical protein
MADFKISRIRFTWRSAWTAATAYTKDDIIRYGGKAYVCLVGHTSAADFNTDLEYINTSTEPDTAAPKWELWFDGADWKHVTRTAWATGVSYNVGQEVSYEGLMFRCILAHTSDTFAIDLGLRWEFASSNWRASTFYQLGNIVKYGSILYICVDSHTSAATTALGLEQDQSKWSVILSTDNWRADWQVSYRYRVNDIVKYNSLIYRCITSHTSNASTDEGLEFDQAKWTVLTKGESWTSEWTTNRFYHLGNIVKYGGIVYRCVEAHVSADTIYIGLEADQSKWETVISGIFYRGTWANDGQRYKINDVVKYGADLWICTEYHTSTNDSALSFQTDLWDVWIPGLEYDEDVWSSSGVYQFGDVVKYGGYSYTSKTLNINKVPSTQTSDWELLTIGFKILGEYSATIAYKTGDVIRREGYLYVCIVDTTAGTDTDNPTYWELVIPGQKNQGNWEAATTYVLGDLAMYASTMYICVLKNSNNNPSTDAGTHWIKLIEGTVTNVLRYLGDIKTHSASATKRLAIGDSGNILKVTANEPSWETFGEVSKVFYVALNGTDTLTSGTTLNSPFRTIKYACEFIQDDLASRAPATILIKTGVFQEILPISVPANVALVGDELRSTVVEPAGGYADQDMFYVRNGSGIRNMTLRGLQGTLSDLNQYLTRRPTGGAFVSLDPGTSTADSSTWITTRSPYIQNVTTFGIGCVGMKVDGALHDGGNKSIVANDFTQVLSDGIGAWVTNKGLSELVSVFSYYGYAGYLAEAGGKIRATNGNSSYGTYGVIAEGVDADETPITGTINNRLGQALVNTAFSGQTNTEEILMLEYANAGESYSSATLSIVGAGSGVSTLVEDFRNGAVFEARIMDPGDSSTAGGASYVQAIGSAQAGTDTTITIAVNDSNEFATYDGMRILITSGTGVGQYGYITSYDTLSKLVGVNKESNGLPGWDHLVPGTEIESALDSTTRYSIEPRVTFDTPAFTTNTRNMPVSSNWQDIGYGDNKFVAIALSNNDGATSTNGTSWTSMSLPTSTAGWRKVVYGSSPDIWVAVGEASLSASSSDGVTWTSASMPTGIYKSAAYGAGYFVAVASGEASTTAAYSTNGTSWSAATIPSGDWVGVAYGFNRFVAITAAGTATAYSLNGTSWTAGGSLPSSSPWNSIAYGKGRFVAIAGNEFGASTAAAVSLDGGVNWIESEMPASAKWSTVAYGQGVFFAVSTNGTVAATSPDGINWTQRVMPSSDNWTALAFGNPGGTSIWTSAGLLSANAASIITGAQAQGRVTVGGGRISLVKLWDPGSGYLAAPNITITDPSNSSEVRIETRIGNGVLGQPTFLNRGTGYKTTSTTVTVSGNGYADVYPLDKYIDVSNLTLLPGPGANLNITGINDVLYKIITVEQLSGTAPNITARFRISPILDRAESPAHGTTITIREKYSQVRLTGHDFLYIGTGNLIDTGYPTIDILELKQEQETYSAGGGRVFYTSTDQDGNFRVGELFKVEQATGTVTISADFFSLTGLEELAIGGVSVGGSGVVIREFSTDNTFTADSNNIIPTQRAIKAYLERRLTGGSADATTPAVTAGTVRVGTVNNIIGSTAGDTGRVVVSNKMNFTRGVDGSMLAMTYFKMGF